MNRETRGDLALALTIAVLTVLTVWIFTQWVVP